MIQSSNHSTGFALGVLLLLGCADAAQEPLDLTLDPSSNVVRSSPVPFSPRQGGFGLATIDGVQSTRMVLTPTTLRDAGETNCGQFSRERDDLELTLHGVLAPGEYPVVSAAHGARSGSAELSWASRGWNAGKVVITEGQETRGTRVRGTIRATNDAGEVLDIMFDAPFAGCGRD